MEPLTSGFELATAILIGMLGALLYAAVALVHGLRGSAPQPAAAPTRAIPLLALAGLGITAYLIYVETWAVPAICGPVGDCNAVQSSPYSRLFGIPMGVVGAAGYTAILVAWLWAWRTALQPGSLASVTLFCLALFGTLLSLYMTYLEPFVIRAVCAWCLASAVLMTLLLLLSVGPAQRVLAPSGVE